MDGKVRIAQITIVEDNPGDVLLLRKALDEQGITFALTSFTNGEEALQHFAREDHEHPDLILLDLNLPMIEGVAVLQKIRSIPYLFNVPVAILSSSTSPSDIHRTKLLGVDRYISKPTGLGEFLREVGREVQEMLLASPHAPLVERSVIS